MNSSDLFILPLVIDKLESRNLSIDIFYIGTLIGLIGGLLTMCIISYLKYRATFNSHPIEVSVTV